MYSTPTKQLLKQQLPVAKLLTKVYSMMLQYLYV